MLITPAISHEFQHYSNLTQILMTSAIPHGCQCFDNFTWMLIFQQFLSLTLFIFPFNNHNIKINYPYSRKFLITNLDCQTPTSNHRDLN